MIISLTLALTLALALYIFYLFLPQWDLWLYRTRRVAKNNGRICCLTFDDGPSKEWTPQILGILKDAKIKATFFITGEHAGKCPQIVKQINEEGHEIGNHTTTHSILTFLSKRAAHHEITNCNNVLAQLIGRSPSLFRAPHGFKRPYLKKMLSKLGLTLVPWTKGIWDTDMPPAEVLLERVKKRLKPLEILLLHDGIDNRPILQHRRPTVEALPLIIEEYKRRGYEFRKISQITDH